MTEEYAKSEQISQPYYSLMPLPKNSLGDVEKWNDVNPNASTRQFGWAAYYTNIYYANAIIDKKR